MNEQAFGNIWTTAKLEIIESYLEFYTTALKKQNFKLCYIDAFAGSGTITIKGGRAIDGSAIRSLKYGFDRFYFFEKNNAHYQSLQQKIEQEFRDLAGKVVLKNEDCNKLLMEIDKYDWMSGNWRGVIFLDPYAMQLSWECLEKIGNTRAFDVWYLFPFSAVNRNLYNNKKIPEANKKAITKILGTADWEAEIYKESNQLTLFGEPDFEKDDAEGIKDYIIKRLQSVFPTVSDKAALLRTERNAPMFLLCFAGSNPGAAAKKLSLKAADYILAKI